MFRSRLLPWLLVCFLLLGQTLALAHDHDTDAGAETHCALCLFAQHADGSLPGQDCDGPCLYAPVLHPRLTRKPVCIEARTPYHSRAPPITFL